MKNTLFLTASSLSTLAFCQTTADQQYIDSVCSPNVTFTAGLKIAPCRSVKNIQEQCKPNGTLPLQLAAHAQCLCNRPSSFFDDWWGCTRCIKMHGGMTSGNMFRDGRIMMYASSALCSGITTGIWEDLWTKLSTAGTYARDATDISDYNPGVTDVSLYFTDVYSQGPGPVTGNATLPVATFGVHTPVAKRGSSFVSHSATVKARAFGTITSTGLPSTTITADSLPYITGPIDGYSQHTVRSASTFAAGDKGAAPNLDTRSSTVVLENGALPSGQAVRDVFMASAGDAVLAVV